MGSGGRVGEEEVGVERGLGGGEGIEEEVVRAEFRSIEAGLAFGAVQAGHVSHDRLQLRQDLHPHNQPCLPLLTFPSPF